MLPALAGEFKNNKMIPFLLPLLFLLAEDYSSQEYTNLLWPVLVPVFLVQDPVQVCSSINAHHDPVVSTCMCTHIGSNHTTAKNGLTVEEDSSRGHQEACHPNDSESNGGGRSHC